MMRRTVLTTAMMILVVFAASAQTSARATESFRNAGYRVIDTRSEGGLPTWDLEDGSGNRFSVSLIGTLTDTRASALDAVTGLVFGLDGLTVQRMRVVFDDDRATAVVIPGRLRINGRDYVQYLPSGMQFIFDEALAFDFRMLVNNLAARVNGQFLTQAQLYERIQRAVENPAAFIQSSDPQFLARRIEEQQDMLDERLADDLRQDERDAELTARIDEVASDGREVALSLEERLAAVQAAHDQLREEHDALVAESSELIGRLADELTRTRAAVAILTTHRLFGGLRVVAVDALLRVAELRAADPGLSMEDALAQVNAELPEGAEQLHSRHVEAIYALFFNQFPE